MAAWGGNRIHQLEQLTLHSFDAGFVDAAVSALERRNALTVSRVEGQLYLEVNGTALSTAVHVHQLG